MTALLGILKLVQKHYYSLSAPGRLPGSDLKGKGHVFKAKVTCKHGTNQGITSQRHNLHWRESGVGKNGDHKVSCDDGMLAYLFSKSAWETKKKQI